MQVTRRLFLATGWLAAFCVLPPLAPAQLTALNFVYTGVGGQSDLIRYTYAQDYFKKLRSGRNHDLRCERCNHNSGSGIR